jgi:cell fate (sporulation/competence/biofilm development) regulator YlbF (YheA/YmcA/DUF963 family)
MTLEEKARELGRIIGQSPEYQAVKRASETLQRDREASSLLQRLEQVQADAQRMLERGQQPTEELERQHEKLVSEVQTNPACQGLVVAQENFDKIMARVNQWILEGIRKGAASSIITLS